MQALAQACNLRKRGYETTVITLRHDRAWPKCEEIEGVPVLRVAGGLVADRERLPALFKKLAYLAGLLVVAFTLWQQRARYDILHVYQLNLLALPLAFVCRLTGKPMIVAVRSTSTRSVEAMATHREIGGDLAPLEALGKPVVRFTRALLRHNRAVVIVLSTRMRSYLTAHNFNLPDVRLIPNGVDVTRFIPPDGAASGERAQCVVCISKLRYEKGIDVLLRSWRLVMEQLPQSAQARLVIVGDGPLRSQLERLVEELGITDCVEFAGLRSDVPVQLRRGSLAVLPSRWEGMPNALLEAMACGLACVATRVSGSEDMIQHGINGLLVEPEDDEGMAQALLTLLCDSALAERYGQAAREAVEQRYAFERIMDTYVELYRSLVGETSVKTGDTPVSEMSHIQ
jgi:glycosyltransferase involved in cell wall biosynthesis